MCDEIRCPRCGSFDVISYGRTKRGRPRRKCNACGRTFSLTTGTVMFSRKLKIKKLRAMINLMLNDTKLKAIADSVGIAPSTAYLWRMKIYTAARKIRDGALLSGRVWIDEKLIPVNRGQIWRKPDGKKPRGVSRNQVCVACAVDGEGNRYAEVAGKGHISSLQCLKTYGKHIAKGSALVHDGIFSHDALVARIGGRSEVHKSTTREAHEKLQPVNSFIAEIERYLVVHPGLRTEYLDLYCAWVAFKASITAEKMKDKIDELLQICEETPAEFYRKDRHHRD